MNIMYVRFSDDALGFIPLAAAKIRFKSKSQMKKKIKVPSSKNQIADC